MVLVRRFLVLAALMFWQGGFVFYASVVVPTGTDIFNRYYHSDNDDVPGRRHQGRITRNVARWLNVAGAVALVPLGWDTAATRDPKRRRVRRRGLLCAAIALLLAALLWFYYQLDGQFNVDKLVIADEALFSSYHRAYLWIAAAQWVCCMLWLLLSLAAWRAQDRTASVVSSGHPSEKSETP